MTWKALKALSSVRRLSKAFGSDCEPVASDGEALCDRCSRLNVDQIFAAEWVSRVECSDWGTFFKSKKIADLSGPGALDVNLSCSFCVLIRDACLAHARPTEANLGLYAFRYYVYTDKYRVDKVYRFCLGVKSANDSLSSANGILVPLDSLDSLDPRFSQDLFGQRQIASNRTDFDLIRDCIASCEEFHGCSLPHLPSSVLATRFVDCLTRTIVPGETSQQYVALSYIWGASQGSANGIEGSLPAELPLTVEDAITATKSLGLRYLWVDRYCIDQKDTEEVHDQIRQMDKIYAGARVTIVAAAGVDPSYGLPGVSKTPRKVRHSASLGKQVWVSLAETPNTPICRSAWMSRGWTYQEALFSRTLLIFTDQYVYFECGKANWCETDLSTVPTKIRNNIILTDSRARESTQHSDIYKHISEYSKRRLTYDSDALNGMLGIFRSFEEDSTFPVYHYQGVPVLPVKGTFTSRSVSKITPYFANGLCWYSDKPGVRRPQFPSWSWTGWTCWVNPTSVAEPAYDNSQMQIEIFDPIMQRMTDFEAYWSSTDEYDRSARASNMLRISAWVINIRLLPNVYTSLFGDDMCSYSTEGHWIRTMLCLPGGESEGHDVNPLAVHLEEMISKQDDVRQLFSQSMKGIIFGNVDDYGSVEKKLFVLVVKRVASTIGADRYERIGTASINTSAWMKGGQVEPGRMKYVTWQSVIVV